MKFTLRIETPVHVGSGQFLSWLDYSLVGRDVHVFDWKGILDAAAVSRDDVAERLAAFTDQAAKTIDEAQRAVQKAPGRERTEILRRARDQTDPIRFARGELKNDVLARAMKGGDYDRYRAEFLGGRLDRRLEIREQAKDHAGQPTIPASAVRGQIRTAIIHHVLATGDDDVAKRVLYGGYGAEGWRRGLKEATPGRARFLFGDDVEAASMRVPVGSETRRHSDPRFDLLRFLRISEPVRSRASLVVVRASPFQISKSRERDASVRTLPLAPTVMEAIEEGSEFEYDLRVDAPLLIGLASSSGGDHPFTRDEFWAMFTRAFGVAREEATTMEPAALEERVLSAVQVALASRMNALIARERRWCEQVGVPKGAGPRELLDQLEKESERIPMRIGFGAGLHATTSLLALEGAPIYGEPLGRVLARVGLGLPPRVRRERAEREKHAIEKARKEAFGGGGDLALREDLLAETVDSKRLPVSRRFTMAGGSPDEMLGYATFAAGELSAEAPKRKERPTRGPRDAKRDRGDSRPDRRGKERVRREPRRNIPDRPANQTELENLFKKFGPRH